MKKPLLHVQILISLALGILFAIFSIQCKIPINFNLHYIKPFGTIFLNSLKMIAVPMVLTSLVVGITNIKDATKLSRIGKKTLIAYLFTTMFAVVLGLFIVNFVQPGKLIPEKTREHLVSLYQGEITQSNDLVKKIQKETPLQFLVDMFPENLFSALSDNLNLLQVVIISIFFGVALLQVSGKKSRTLVLFFEGMNDVVMIMLNYIMKLAPIGVFALTSSLLVELGGGNSSTKEFFNILYALLGYVTTVLLSLFFMTFIFYPFLLKIFTKVKIIDFLKAMLPAQLIAFTTSSSSASLPINMEQLEKKLGVSEEISSFVLPLGATVNMDGTALYQSIAVVFIAQALGLELSISNQLMILLQITVSSIGVAGVPSVSIVTTVMILELIGIPVAGLALILAPDRILDMCRTATNITGDALVAVMIASSEDAITNETLLSDTSI